MKLIFLVAFFVVLPACAHLGLVTGQRDRTASWIEAHNAFSNEDFARASALFSELAERHPNTLEGRESLFYLGTMRLDPRNPHWDPQPAEAALARYLASDTMQVGAAQRRPEGQTLLQLAQQLNMAPRDRVPGLQPEVVTREVEVQVQVPRVVVTAQESRALSAEVERLRGQVAERDATIRQQREELERIRRTLARPPQE
ncbi:hypothetical protein BH23GEM6_BH23GEM6_09610 [soil metagenome]